jgi:multiple RNA-binding domain-containing protein 1
MQQCASDDACTVPGRYVQQHFFLVFPFYHSELAGCMPIGATAAESEDVYTVTAGAEVRSSAQDMPEASAPVDARQRTSESQADAVALIGQTSKLFVRNLPFVTTDEDLLPIMNAFGDIVDAKIVRDKSTGASKGFGVVQFKAAADAVAAFQALDGEAFQGRLLHIIPGKASEPASIVEGAEAEGSKQVGFKAERDSKRKANAGDKSTWSTFFMREDTVAQAAADLLGITKAELLDPEAPDAAVRLALGEIQARLATRLEYFSSKRF